MSRKYSKPNITPAFGNKLLKGSWSRAFSNDGFPWTDIYEGCKILSGWIIEEPTRPAPGGLSKILRSIADKFLSLAQKLQRLMRDAEIDKGCQNQHESK